MSPTKTTQKVLASRPPKNIRKRDGTLVPFEIERITSAVAKAMRAADEGGEEAALRVAEAVAHDLAVRKAENKHYIPVLEEIQDLVERQMILKKFPAAAKAYILYRQRRAELRDIRREVPARVREMVTESKKYFRNQLSEFVFYTAYSRWIEEENRRETWAETVDRYLSFMRENLGEKLHETEYSEIREFMLGMKALGSMRLLQFAGKAARATNVAAYNCSFIAPTQWQDFAEVIYLSMCGTGVGFAVEEENIGMLPMIKRQTGEKLATHMIGDSKEEWANALTLGLKTWAVGKDVAFDYSHIRPRGARLKTMGGRASGPDPLHSLLDFARERMLARQGRRLKTIDAHDIICKIGECVVAGGVRRSALISLSSLDDMEMREAKNGQFYLNHPERSMANNSVAYNEKPTMPQFLDEWVNLAKAGSGERGIFNRGSLKHQLPTRRWKVIEPDLWTVGTNPCVTSDTWVMTTGGPLQVKDLVGLPFEAVVDGRVYPSLDGFWKTGTKAVYEVSTKRGFSFRATENHQVLTVAYRSRKKEVREWKEVKDLASGDLVVLHHHDDIEWVGRGDEKEGWLLGSLVGDGNLERSGKANLDFWGPSREIMMDYAVGLVHETVGGRSDLAGHMARTGYARVGSTALGQLAASYCVTYRQKFASEEIEKTSSAFHRGFLRGWFDADGSVQGNQKKGVSVRLSSNSLESLHRAQRMLARLGVISTIYTNRRPAMMRPLPDGRGGVKEYPCEPNHELLVSGSNVAVFARRVHFTQPEKKARLDAVLADYHRSMNREFFSAEVAKVIPSGTEDVYDCSVPGVHAFDANGLFLHNCGEIILKSKQFCNLSEVVARPEDTEDTLMEKVRIATILGTYQASLTKFPYLSPEWKKNCADEALLGVSITGQWDCPALQNASTFRKLKEVAIETNRKYAERFGINRSTAITCVKPSGQGSQLFDSSSGMHPRHAKHYIRRVRIEGHNPVFHMLKDMGVPHHPEVGQEEKTATTWVLEFPIKAPSVTKTFKNDLTAIEQLDYWKIVKENYTEHNPSTTISVSEEEWLEVGNWVYENWEMIGGLSFLPRSNHVYRLAPYEEITEEEYEKRAKAFPDIDFSKLVLYEYDDTTEAKKELACAAGTCEIDPLMIGQTEMPVAVVA